MIRNPRRVTGNSAGYRGKEWPAENSGLFGPTLLSYGHGNPAGPPNPATGPEFEPTHVWQERGNQVVRRSRMDGTG